MIRISVGSPMMQMPGRRPDAASAFSITCAPMQPQIGGRDARRQRQGAGDEALHVAGPPAIDAPVALDRCKRVGGPVLPLDRHHVGVAAEHDPAVDIRPDGGEQVGLVAGRVQRHFGFRAQRIQPRGAPGDQFQVRIRRDGRKPDHLNQDRLCVLNHTHGLTNSLRG
jgi:hypothetical protein